MNRIRAIGIDIGTTTICGLVLDGATGEVLDTITVPNQAVITKTQWWEKLQDASVLVSQTEEIIAKLISKYAPIASIGITGQMHGIVYTDDKGDAVSPLFSWQDERGNLIYRDGLSYAQYLSELTGYKLAAGFGAVTHFYNTVNHLVPEPAASFCTIMDYVGMKLTNTFKPLTHCSNAASIGLFDTKAQQFDKEAIGKSKMEVRFFPTATKGVEQIGTTSLGIPVAAAIGDNQASFIGSVKNSRDCLLVNIGTSSQISLFTDSSSNQSNAEIRPLIHQDFILVGSPLCGGRAYALLESFFRAVAEQASGKELPKLYELMETFAEGGFEIENPLEIATQFCGTRENPSLRGSIHNLGIDNFTPQHFTIGVLQGMVSELYTLYEGMKPQLSQMPKKLIGSGNGLRMNKTLQKMLVKCFDMPLAIPNHKEEASFGAALLALTSAGVFKDIEAAQQLIQYE